jgi:hypothetical protein
MVGRLTALWATLVVVLLGVVAPLARAADDSGTVVLGVEAVDTQDNNLASDVTDAIKQRVATGKGGPLIPGKDLVEIKLVFSCSDEAPACLAQAGKSLGAAKLIYGTIKRSGGEIVLMLKQVDTAHGTVDGTSVENLSKKRLDPSALRALSGQWMARLNGARSGGGGGGTPGTLMVRSNVSGATVMLDGAEVGTLTRKTLSIENVSPGKHEITVEKPGFGVSTQVFTIGAGQALPLTLTLLRGDGSEGEEGATPAATGGEGDGTPRRIATPPDEPPGGDDSLRGWVRTGFWVALGVSAVSLGLATKYGLDVRSVNQDLNPYREPNPTKSDPNGTVVRGLLADGNRAETRQWIFIGVGSAAAVAGGFLLYKGYLDKEAGSGAKTADNHGLRVFPTANTSSGGIAAEFDF